MTANSADSYLLIIQDLRTAYLEKLQQLNEKQPAKTAAPDAQGADVKTIQVPAMLTFSKQKDPEQGLS